MLKELLGSLGRMLHGASSGASATNGTHEPGGTFITFQYQNKRMYKVYVPAGYRAGTPLPLLVMIHGCKQNPDDFAIGTEMNKYAERHNLLVVYPEQPRSGNPDHCWNWFRPENQQRGNGEPAELAAIVDQVRRHYSVDSDRIYAAGISSGAAMAGIMGITYPDVFAAVGLCSGLAYQSATNGLQAFLAQAGWGRDPKKSAQAAFEAMGPYRRVMPVMLFQGTGDKQLAPSNAQKAVEQWLVMNDMVARSRNEPAICMEPARVIAGQPADGQARPFTLYSYTDERGQSVLEYCEVEQMPHAWSGGAPPGSFTDPQGPEASEMLITFFLAHPMPRGQQSHVDVLERARGQAVAYANA